MSGEIAALHAEYLSGARSPVEVTRRHLELAEEANGRLNAFTRLLPERAMEAARASEERYRRHTPRSVMDGVPVSVKDLLHVAGVPTTSGSEAAPGGVEAADAALVTALADGGAVVYAKTNLLEFAYGLVHPAFGPAHNPWDLTRSSSGSSSGSGVAVAAGLGFMSIGTDTAGSIRGPASWCGVVGLKPTHGLVPTFGVAPLSPTLDHAGPLARTVDDCRVSLELLTGRALRYRGEKRLRIGVARLPGATAEVQEACDALVARLAEDGADVRPALPIDFDAGNAANLVILYAEALEVHGARLAERWSGYSVATRARILSGIAVGGPDYVRARYLRRALQAAWAEGMADLDALVYPTSPEVAIPEATVSELSDATLYTASQAVLGVPAISVPAGLGRESGLPVAIQVSGRAGEEAMVLEVAARLEAVRGPMPHPPHYADPLG